MTYDDAESVYEPPATPGAPVDPPDRPVVYADIVARTADRRPIVPASLRSRTQRRTLAQWARGYVFYWLLYHSLRSPKYLVKVLIWAPFGLVRGTGRLVWWARAEEGNWALRQHAASRNDAKEWLQLDHTRERQSSWRGPLVLVMFVLLAAGVVVLNTSLVPGWVRWVALAVAVIVLARVGRPADRPITDRINTGPTYRKLTAEIVRRGLASLGVAGINQALAKDPGAITFPQEIHRDGPGYLATVDLPYGVEAVEVIDRRGRLASALRLPMDQVWPETSPGHTGRLALWVGDEPASAVPSPAWPLARRGQVDLFGTFPFATDPRGRPVNAALMYRNWLIGAMPGAGKTFALRLLLLAAGLDPRAELHVYELKGSGDLDALEPVCVEYGSGADDETAERALEMLRALRQECGRRAELVKAMARAGKAPENKVIAEIVQFGLAPLVAAIDECQELFSHSVFGKEAGELATQVIKLGRALGIILLLATQRPDKDSLPTGVSANVNTRFCLRVMGQVENDMILGTSMYKQGFRATQFTDRDLGWGWLAGVGSPSAVRGYYVDGPGAQAIVARAVQLRGGPVVPAPRERAQAYSLLDDLRAVWPTGEEAAWSELLLDGLKRLRPEHYDGWDVRAFGAAARAAGVPVVSVHRKVDRKGATRYGIRFEALMEAIEARPARFADRGASAIDSWPASPPEAS